MSGKMITIQNYSKFPLRWLDNAKGKEPHAPQPFAVPSSKEYDERTGTALPGTAVVHRAAWERFKTSPHKDEIKANLERGVWREGRVIA